MIIQMLVGDSVIVVNMEPFYPFSVESKEFFYIQTIYVGMSYVDKGKGIRYVFKNLKVFIICKNKKGAVKILFTKKEMYEG